MNEQSIPPTSQREHMRLALEVAERLRTDYYLAPPRSLTLQGPPFDEGPYSLELCFHQNPERLAEWAGALGLPVTFTARYGPREKPYVEARGEVHGVQIRMWTLGDLAEHDRYRACASESSEVAGLPAEWSASAVSA